VNNIGIEDGKFVSKTLSRFTINELIEMANKYSSGR
jgi:hypothetical protein